jgi:hypothetical protein
MKRIPSLLLILLLAGFLGACTTPAPPYSASVANLEVTGKLAGTMSVGKFQFDKGREADLNSIGARASSFTSPINNSYADYFGDAAAKELKAAGKFDAASPRVLTGVLVKNYLTAAGMQVNESDLQVRFRLAQGEKTLYEKLVQAQSQWESSFLGAVAIPRALDNYVATLQKLMGNLFADPDFVRASAAK